MKIKRLPLLDRLSWLSANEAAHPEYDRTVIRSVARMPIIRYLGDYDTFCDFQILTEMREDLSYQAAAQVIADEIYSPSEDMSQILDMLAGPIVQIEEAYRQGKSTLLPFRKRARTAQRVKPLASRLEDAGVLAGPPYACCCLPVQRFFRAVSALTGDQRFLDVYQTSIRPYVPDENTLFRQAVYDINALQEPERTELLYQILIEPFAALPAESEVSI